MAYTPTNWQDSPATTTPITAANLNKIETELGALDGGKAPVSSAWTANTAVKAGQILVNNGAVYQVNADMTTPNSFATTGLTAVAVRPPASTERFVWVSTGANANDNNDGLTVGAPKATIAAALTALNGNPGVIQLMPGTWTISAVDSHGNGVTLGLGQELRGSGVNSTTVTIDVNATWGVQCLAARGVVRDLTVTVNTGRTVTYGVGVSTSSANASSQGCRFENVYMTTNGSVTAAFAIGPNWPGSSTLDIANCIFDNCTFNGTPQDGFLVGNGTSGNVLLNHAINCTGSGATRYGVNMNAGGLNFTGGGFSGIAVADIHFSGICGQPYVFDNLWCENGKRFLDVGYIGPTYGIHLLNCSAQAYTPADNIIIQHNAAGMLKITGGHYEAGAGTLISLNSAGSPGAVTSFDASGVNLDNTSATGGWPALNTTSYLRRITNASYKDASGYLSPNPNFRSVIDNAAPIMGEVDSTANSATLTTTAADIPGATVTFTAPTAGKVTVTGSFDINLSASSDFVQGLLAVDGTVQGPAVNLTGSVSRATISRSWTVSLAAGSHTIKLQAKLVSGATTSTNGTHTGFTYQFVPGAA